MQLNVTITNDKKEKDKSFELRATFTMPELPSWEDFFWQGECPDIVGHGESEEEVLDSLSSVIESSLAPFFGIEPVDFEIVREG